MEHEIGPKETERRFFAALMAGDENTLGEIIADDFLLIDVMTGSEISKADLIAVIGSRQLVFLTVDVLETNLRSYGDAAIVTGRTSITGLYGGTPFAAASRYTHVYIRQEERWRLVTAQGTPIVEATV